MLSLHRSANAADSVSCQRPPPSLAAAVRQVLAVAGLLTACGGNPVEFPPPPNDTCLGSPVGLTPQRDTVSVGDSVHVAARPTQAFTSCLSGVPFVIRWEARPDSAVVLSPDSDTSAWVRGVAVGTVGIFARITSMEEVFGLMTIVVR